MAPHHDWYLREWIATLGVKQAHLVRDLDMNKAKASLLVSCKQQYTRDDVNLIAGYLNLKPYELLMHPTDAMAIRALRTDAIKIAHSTEIASEAASSAVADQKKVSLG